MTSEITKFKRYLCFLTLEEKFYEVEKFIEALLTDKHPKNNVKNKYKVLEQLRLIITFNKIMICLCFNI